MILLILSLLIYLSECVQISKYKSSSTLPVTMGANGQLFNIISGTSNISKCLDISPFVLTKIGTSGKTGLRVGDYICLSDQSMFLIPNLFDTEGSLCQNLSFESTEYFYPIRIRQGPNAPINVVLQVGSDIDIPIILPFNTSVYQNKLGLTNLFQCSDQSTNIGSYIDNNSSLPIFLCDSQGTPISYSTLVNCLIPDGFTGVTDILRQQGYTDQILVPCGQDIKSYFMKSDNTYACVGDSNTVLSPAQVTYIQNGSIQIGTSLVSKVQPPRWVGIIIKNQRKYWITGVEIAEETDIVENSYLVKIPISDSSLKAFVDIESIYGLGYSILGISEFQTVNCIPQGNIYFEVGV